MPGITNHYFDTYDDARTARRLLLNWQSVGVVTLDEGTKKFTFHTWND